MTLTRTSPFVFHIALIGVGLVGKELLQQLIRQSPRFSRHEDVLLEANILLRGALDIQIVALANSKSFWINEMNETILDVNTAMNRLQNSSRSGSFHQWIEELSQMIQRDRRNTIVVDCTASEEVASAYPFILSHGFHIVAANKKAFASSLYDEIYQTALLHRRFCFHEATVGAGLPVLSTINDMFLTGDSIYQIEGIFSGTLGYIFALLNSKDRSFSEVVLEAQKYGYTVSGLSS
jgi:homoserine dehydrogenase